MDSKMTKINSPISTGTLAFILITTAIICETKCPDNTWKYGDFCFAIQRIVPSSDNQDAKTIQVSHAFTAEKCAQMKGTGKGYWRLPKPETVDKNADIGKFLKERLDDATRNGYIRIGLRRYDLESSNQETWAKGDKWYWTDNNTTLWSTIGVKRELWIDKHPQVGEECAVGFYDDGKFKWQSAACEDQTQTKKLDRPINVVVCETPVPIAIYETGWFYGMCIAIMAISLVMMIAGCILMWWRRPKLPQVPQPPQSRQRRSPGNRRSDRERLPRKKFVFEKQPKKATRTFKWYQPPTIGKDTSTMGKLNMKSTMDEGEGAGYENVMPKKPKLKSPGALKRGSKML